MNSVRGTETASEALADQLEALARGPSPRRVTLGSGTVALQTPGVPYQEPFESKIIRKYQWRSDVST